MTAPWKQKVHGPSGEEHPFPPCTCGQPRDLDGLKWKLCSEEDAAECVSWGKKVSGEDLLHAARRGVSV